MADTKKKLEDIELSDLPVMEDIGDGIFNEDQEDDNEPEIEQEKKEVDGN